MLVALAVAALSGRLLLDQRAGGATTAGALGFSIAMMAPFLSALAAFLMRSREPQRAVWVASGVLALALGVVTIFSVGLLFMVAGLGLLWAWWLSREPTSLLGPARAIAVSGWLLLWLGGALTALWLRETPMCWDAGANGSGWVATWMSSECTSDIIDDSEGLLALGGVALGFLGVALLTRGGSNEAEAAAGKDARENIAHRARRKMAPR